MKKTIILLSLLSVNFLLGQTMEEVIEGPNIKSGKIYLDHELRYKFQPESPENFKKLTDSIIINLKNNNTGRKRNYSVFIKAYNPIRYTVESSATTVVDQLHLQLNQSLREIIAFIESQTNKNFSASTSMNKNDISKLKSKIQNNSKKCLKLIKAITTLSFNNKDITEDSLGICNNILEEIKTNHSTYFTEVSQLTFDCLNDTSCKDIITIQNYAYLLNTHLQDQRNLIFNIESLLDKISVTMSKWKEHHTTDNSWYIKIEHGSVSRKEMAAVTIKISEHRVSIKENNIEQETSKEIKKKTIRFRKYSLFINENVSGITFSNLEYPSYSIEENAQGENIIGKVDEKALEKVAISTMINFNLNISDTPILPFLQLGVGYSGKLPIGLVGGGLRFDLGSTHHITLSSGLSFTGIKTLNTLSVGQVVKDETQIQNDLTYQFSGPKLYWGIQYNF